MSENSKSSIKWSFIGTVIAALIAGGVALFIHFDSKQNLSKYIVSTKDEKQAESQKIVTVTIGEVFITPVSFDMPATFYAEIVNPNAEVAEDFFVTLNFGRAKIEKFSIKPGVIVEGQPIADAGILKYKIKKLTQNESLYIYCFLSDPVFDKIVINGGNLTSEEALSFNGYQQNRKNIHNTNALLRVVLIFFGIPFGIYIMIVIMKLINKWLKLEW